MSKKEGSSLERKFISIMIIATFLISFLFLSANITGNAVFDSSFKSSNFVGAGLFIAALIASFFYFKNRK